MLKKSVPLFVAEMTEIAELFGTEQAEIDRMRAALIELLDQFYIKTATYSLDNWEEEFGLEKNSLLSEAQRRARVLGKLNSNPPATVKMIENLVFQILDANFVTVIEHYADYSFDIYVNTDYLLENLSIADAAVYKARPAHLNYKFINGLIRKSTQKIYVGIHGNYIGIKKGVVNTDELYAN